MFISKHNSLTTQYPEDIICDYLSPDRQFNDNVGDRKIKKVKLWKIKKN